MKSRTICSQYSIILNNKIIGLLLVYAFQKLIEEKTKDIHI